MTPRFGVVFPTTEIGNDPAAIRAFAETAEGLGFQHLLAFDHVLGANAATYKEMAGPYRHTHPFHEPFVLLGYVAGLTRRIELGTAVIILPQRQTALVAKQAAEVDVLSGGRMRLGVGIGWNPVEYEALGVPMVARGPKQQEQIEVLQALWSKPLVTFKGQWHTITDAGLNPLPKRPIPIWMGGSNDAVMRRIARHAQGWYPRPELEPGTEKAAHMWNKIQRYLAEEKRDIRDLGIQVWVAMKDHGHDPAAWAKVAAAWIRQGATHIALNTMDAGLTSAEAHVDAIRRFKAVVDSL
ncbi:MAG: LLM class F420-dependent oxidoreductase [Alphaproteobacteria bacterium]